MFYLDNHSVAMPCKGALEQVGQGLIPTTTPRSFPIYDLAGAKESDRFVFTASAAEAVGTTFWSVFTEIVRKEGKTHIIVSEMEDAPTLQWAKRLETLGCTIKIAPVKEGQIDLDALQGLISPRTALISITMAHGLTGVIQPVGPIAQLAKEKQVRLHLDATYALGKYPIVFDADYLTFAGDRIHSVQSSGGLFVKEGAPYIPLVLGAAVDVSSWMALSVSAQQALLYLDTMALEVARLRDLFESLVEGRVLFANALRLPNTSLIAFEKVHQETLLYYLNRKGVFASIGGTYAGHLSNLDVTAISFALSRMTTEEEVIQAAKIVNGTVKELRALSEAL